MLKRVDLPDPFSPSRACTSPALNSIVMSSLALTGPKRLLMLLSISTAVPGALGVGGDDVCHRFAVGSRCGRHGCVQGPRW